jgi:hypothetical protein
MPKSQHPYFVCADHALDYSELSGPLRLQNMHEYSAEVVYRINNPNATKICYGLHQIFNIKEDFNHLYSDSFIQNNSADFIQQMRERFLLDLHRFVPMFFLCSFRILSPEDANELPTILWSFNVTKTTITAKSFDQSHSLSFSYFSERDALDIYWMIVSVKYTGPFQVQPIPQYEYKKSFLVENLNFSIECLDTFVKRYNIRLCKTLDSMYKDLQRMKQVRNNARLSPQQKKIQYHPFLHRIAHFAPSCLLLLFHVFNTSQANTRSQSEHAQAWLNIEWIVLGDETFDNLHGTSNDLSHFFSFKWKTKKEVCIHYIGPTQLVNAVH